MPMPALPIINDSFVQQLHDYDCLLHGPRLAAFFVIKGSLSDLTRFLSLTPNLPPAKVSLRFELMRCLKSKKG